MGNPVFGGWSGKIHEDTLLDPCGKTWLTDNDGHSAIKKSIINMLATTNTNIVISMIMMMMMVVVLLVVVVVVVVMMMTTMTMPTMMINRSSLHLPPVSGQRCVAWEVLE